MIFFGVLGVFGCAVVKHASTLERLAMYKDSALFPYIHCKCDTALTIKAVDRLPPDAPKYRVIQSGKRVDTVSVLEGYRVMYGYEGTKDFFANAKVESDGRTLAIYEIFSNSDNTVVSIYFLNQGKENRRLNSIDEFKSLRENFIQRFTECMNKHDKEIPILL